MTACATNIKEAVHTDPETSRSVYNFVVDLCVKLGAKPDDLVPFEKYAAAAQSLTRPALGGARAAKRRAEYRACRQAGAADRQAEGPEPPGDRCQVALVDARLAANRKKAAAA